MPTKMPKKMRETLARMRDKRERAEAAAREARRPRPAAHGGPGISVLGLAMLAMAAPTRR